MEGKNHVEIASNLMRGIKMHERFKNNRYLNRLNYIKFSKLEVMNLK